MHSLHHSEEAMNVTTSWRHFWLESSLRVALIFPVIGIIFQTPTIILNTAAALYTLNHTWAHMNIRHSMGRWTLWMMNPQYHRLHHSVEPEHWNRNFADLFPIFDVIFGTAYVPKPGEFPATGLVPHDRPRRVIDGILWPLRYAGLARAENGPQSARRSAGAASAP
jgi:sterol desaturase/sphingolipid hydroxylase (fatty acid hydroxylase superfamily)